MAAHRPEGWQAQRNRPFKPRKLGSNDASTRLSFFFPLFYAMSSKLESGRLGHGYKTVVGGSTGTTTTVFDVSPQLRIIDMSPSDVTESTEGVLISGKIRNFDGVESCTAEFDVSLALYT
jgi:hypothetical protein